MSTNSARRSLLVAVASVTLAGMASTAAASHSWGGYHWARTSNPFTLKLGDNVSSAWDAYLAGARDDWSIPTSGTADLLELATVAGSTNPKNCRAVKGRVEVCNASYGNNGWLGLASISITGKHITQGAVKLNDTYFNTAKYNTSAWRALVMCQEIGHTFGLDHQDESFSNTNLNTCMDYTNSPESNQEPNSHDYEQLVTIYTHLDSTTTLGQGAVGSFAGEIDHNDPRSWGQLVKVSNGGRTGIYELDHGRGSKTVTFVIWTLEANGNRP